MKAETIKRAAERYGLDAEIKPHTDGRKGVYINRYLLDENGTATPAPQESLQAIDRYLRRYKIETESVASWTATLAYGE